MGWPALSLAAYRLARPLLFRVDPERIHRVTLRTLRATAQLGPPGRAVLAVAAGRPRGAAIEVAGLRFRNRVGVAAGFDKDGEALRGWAGLGLGFVEVGTVTPASQPGNPQPRLFRLPTDAALINRMGFNNAGAAPLAARLAAARARLPAGFVVGVNIGRGRETAAAEAIDDYRRAYELVGPHADYVAVNVSSPNTPGLRELQSPGALRTILAALAAVPLPAAPPVFVKLAPDLEEGELRALAHAAAAAGAAGLIVANTTLSRESLRTPAPLRDEAGGLSGRPLLSGMLALVAAARAEVGDRLAIVASGGIASGADAAAAIAAGADLVQLWTGLVYRGPGLIGEAAAAAT